MRQLLRVWEFKVNGVCGVCRGLWGAGRVEELAKAGGAEPFSSRLEERPHKISPVLCARHA